MQNTLDPQNPAAAIPPAGKHLLEMADKMETLRKSSLVALQIHNRLKALGLNKTQFAQLMGCSAPMATKLLRGNQNLTLETLTKIERVLGLEKLDLHQQLPNDTKAKHPAVTKMSESVVFVQRFINEYSNAEPKPDSPSRKLVYQDYEPKREPRLA